MAAHVVQLFIKPGHGQPMTPVPEAQAVQGQGLQGDAAFGRSRRQVLLMDTLALARFDLKPGEVRENITLEGLDTASLQAGTGLQIGEATLEVTGPCAPCDYMDSLRPGLRQAIEGRRGVLAVVHTGGRIRPGDLVATLPASGRPGREVAG